MKKLMQIFLAATAFFSATTSFGAQPGSTKPAASDCVVSNIQHEGRINWFLGLYPTDDLLVTWCRLQTLQGNVTFNILFPYTNASRSWETTLSGVNMPASRIVDIVQSTLPRETGPAVEKDGQPFSKVLLNVVQLQAAAANDKTVLDFAPEHPAAKELALWEPIVIRVKPILLAGQQFKLLVKLKPSIGLLSLALQKRATDVTLEGWRGRLPLGTFFNGECSSLVPICKDLPETVRFHAPWIIDSVELTTEGESMTASALQIADQLLKSNSSVVPAISPLSGFNLTTGEGSFTLDDPYSSLTFVAKGSPAGTRAISILYRGEKGPYSIGKMLEKEAQNFRGAVENKPKPKPPVPESLGRL